MKLLNKILGQFGLGNYCTCGTKKVWLYTHGYGNYEVWVCPHCESNIIKEHTAFKNSINKLKKL